MSGNCSVFSAYTICEEKRVPEINASIIIKRNPKFFRICFVKEISKRIRIKIIAPNMAPLKINIRDFIIIVGINVQRRKVDIKNENGVIIIFFFK